MGEPIPEGFKETYVCPRCSKFFATENAFRYHFQVAHPQHEVQDIRYDDTDPVLCGARCRHKLYEHGTLHECVLQIAHDQVVMPKHLCNCGRTWWTGDWDDG